MEEGWFVKTNDIKNWTANNKRTAEERLPELVRKLILASSKVESLHFPSGDSVVARSGYDGKLKVIGEGSEYVPEGKSVWEIGTRKDANSKANEDYDNRTKDPINADPSETTFVIVTSRTWDNKGDWVEDKNEEGKWKEVKGINADDLEVWLEQCPAVHRWFGQIIGKRTSLIWDIEQAWQSWKHATSLEISSSLVLNGREEESEELYNLLLDNPQNIVVKGSTPEEAYAFCLATLNETEELISRTLVVRSEEAWDYLIDSNNPLVLIPYQFTPENMGYAKKQGHCILIPRGSNTPDIIPEKIELEKMPRSERIEALKSMGLDEEEANEIYKETHGYLNQIRRHERLEPQESMIPDWIDEFDTNVIVTALFASEWNRKNESDREIISDLADMEYDVFEERLSDLSSEIDPPIRQIKEVWQVISKVNFWNLVSHKISDQIVERLEPVIMEVLGEEDPAFDLSPEERWMANIKGKTPKHSNYLKLALADTLTMLAVFGNDECSNCTINLSNKTSSWCRDLFAEDMSAKGWYSFGNTLSLLAEAAPDEFIEAVESSIKDKEVSMKEIFKGGNSMFGGCPHANILWALETVSWNKNCLPRVTKILAELTEIDPGGNYVNRPLNSLKEIFLGWVRNTTADHKTRIKVIDSHLIKYYPDVAWKLMIALLPGRSSSISNSIRKPEYRNWAEGIDSKKILKKDFWQYELYIMERVIELFREDPQPRLPDLVENITRLEEKYFDRAISEIMSLKIEDFEKETRLKSAKKLREIISHNKKFDGSLSQRLIKDLEEVYHFLNPDDLVLKKKHFFGNSLPDLINPINVAENNYEEEREIINAKRKEILAQIYKEKSIDGVKRLASECKNPRTIGVTAASCELREPLENESMKWLGSGNQELESVANSFVSYLAANDRDWVKNTFQNFESWDEPKQLNFLLALPFDQKIFEILEKADDRVQERYWKEVQPYPLNEDILERIDLVIEKLYSNDRFIEAIRLSNRSLNRSDGAISPSPQLLLDVLDQSVEKLNQDQASFEGDLERNIFGIIKYLQEAEVLSGEDVALIEWKYLKLLRSKSVQPLYLEKKLAKDPAFFVRLVCLVYRPEEDEDKEDKLGEIPMCVIENTRELLDNFKFIPGKEGDHKFDYEILKDWVKEARRLFKDAGRQTIGDKIIGNLLSYCPSGEDDIWPHEAIRNLVEEVQSPDLEIGIAVGKENQRRVSTKSPFEGGEKERELAEEYRERADALRIEWPRTASILREIAKSFEQGGELWDKESELLL